MSARPYFNMGVDALESMFRRVQNDLSTLREILAELDHRATDRAQSLKAQVKRRIEHIISTERVTKNTLADRLIRPESADRSEPRPLSAHSSATSDNESTAATLDRIRQRLLDLTRRNVLLNYSHPAKRSVRVVDEVPDQLFSELLSERALSFKSLPRVPSLGERISDSTRSFLEGQRDPKKPPAAEWAKLHGIRPELELPSVGSSLPRHQDSNIQTLLYPHELEVRLKLMAQLARTAIEESGANILFLAFGFLRWREAEHSEETSYAPLLLVPVTLKKGKGLDRETRREQFTLEYSGEDLQVNLSLRELLRRDFSLNLPDLEETDTPESYATRCRPILIDQPTWSIHRYVTLGFFQFGKLLMYLDLDPKRWPTRGAITEHRIVRQLLHGHASEHTTAGTEPDVDQIPLNAPEAHLIEEADSSQHTAIVAAAQGNDLVIEGPPGTGKSQTITNIIGVALEQGKSVLFVSEKLAALEVVKSRLEASGLGHFCLELHSHKTQKRKFISDIADRLEIRATAPSASTINRHRQQYQDIRDQIAEHLRLVNREVPAYEGTYRHLFCEAAWLRRQLRELGVTLDQSTVGDIHQHPDILEAIDRACAVAKRAREDVKARFGEIASHPWYGLILRNGGESPDAAVGAVNEWRMSVRALASTVESLRLIDDMPALEQYGELRTASILFTQLDHGIHREFQVAHLVTQPVAARMLQRLLEYEASVRNHAERASRYWVLKQSGVNETWKAVGPIVASLVSSTFDLRSKSFEELQSISHDLAQLGAQVEMVAVGVGDIARIVETTVSPDIAGLTLAEKLLRLTSERPLAALGVRSKTIESIEDTTGLRELATEQQQISAEKASLGVLFNVSQGFDVNELKAIRSLLSVAGPLSFLDPDYRRANAIYQRLRHKKVFFRSARKKVEDIDRLINFQTRLTAFLQDGRHTRLLGVEFRGLETPTEHILHVVEWNKSIRSALGRNPDMDGMAGRRLMQLDQSALDQLDALAKSDLCKAIAFANDVLQRLEALSSDLLRHLFHRGWADLPNICNHALNTVSSAVKELYPRLAQTQVPLADSWQVLDKCAELLRNPKRSEVHKRLLVAPNDGIWSAETVASGHRLLAVLREIEHETEGSSIRRALAFASSANRPLQQLLQATASACQRCDKAHAAVDAAFVIDDSSFLGRPYLQTSIKDLAERLKRSELSAHDAASWHGIARSVDIMSRKDAGFEQLRRIAFSGILGDDALYLSARYLALNRMAQDAVTASPHLRDFNAGTHDELIARFKDADNELKRISRALIAKTVLSRPVPQGTSGTRVSDLTQMNLLQREMGKHRRHLPIRQVVQRAGRALQALKPCFMMGPLSVAQYLEPGEIEFDVVIMDEASQMRPEDALGTVARGKQLIVVGDPKQLPPTSFFERMAGDEEDNDDELTFGSQESILDIATPLFAPTRTLTWHYRSQHERLIAFSNHSFYNKKLLLFPTAHSSAEHLGLVYHRVEGRYEGQANVQEAQHLVRSVVQEIRSGRGRSVGIAAVNATQAQVIRDEWDRVTRELPELRELLYEDESGLETMFIKNLENVQGDERDVIFVSLTYGPDTNGNFYQRFGPINREDGWRRLNVLFTRARQQMIVFSSMDSAMIMPGPDAKRGVTALKDFLTYCETGVLSEGGRVSGRGPESPFEEDVATAVRQFGLQTQCQVGVAGFFIDIAVEDPAVRGQYLLGIECDGASYHAARSVRDRDKIRQQILENLGWRIHRIWSTDWFKNESRERQKLQYALEEARAEAERRRQVAAHAKAEAERLTTEASSRMFAELHRDPTVPAAEVLDAAEVEQRNDLRQKLLELRATMSEDFPDVPPEQSLLGDDIIDTLVAVRPTTLPEFHRSVPLARRQRINMQQSLAYLSTVLMVIEDSI